VWGILYLVVFPKAKLPYKVLDNIGKKTYSTLGEVYKQKLGMWLSEYDIVVTQVDGCTYSA
jgi:hypothetical protein